MFTSKVVSQMASAVLVNASRGSSSSVSRVTQALLSSMRVASVASSRVLPASGVVAQGTLARRNYADAAAVRAKLQNAQFEAPAMFCFQCEQTRDNKGCTTVGVCGKTPEVAALQDLLVHALKGVAMFAHRARQMGAPEDAELNVFTIRSMFTTLTNVNFDPERFRVILGQASEFLEKARRAYIAACNANAVPAEELMGAAQFSTQGKSLEQLIDEGKTVGVLKRKEQFGDDVAGVQELLIYGLKGTSAYAEHAEILGQTDAAVFAYIHEALNFLCSADAGDIGKLLGYVLKCGEVNLKVMGLLDAGERQLYGDPTPAQVRITPIAGKCILVSGHDLKDLEEILKQTEGTGINVYTHGELLPAHGYPGLRKYKHLVGNYGGAWQQQKTEFAKFPGAILVTTNCIVEPRKSYQHRIFTSGAAGYTSTTHIANRNFRPVIDAALRENGFAQDEAPQYTTTGFGHKFVLSIADKVIDAVRQGKISRFFVIGGCDGSEGERSYYKKLADEVPNDGVILTMGCGKYRFNKQQFGEVPGTGLPRLLDMGQCNDSYGAVQVALALAKEFNTDVNHLPLSITLSWFEQKAVAVLLSLLSLGVKNIRIGPSLPAFVTPNVLQVLVEKFNLMPIGEASEDMKKMMKQS